VTDTMLAAVYHGPRDIRPEQVPVPEVGPRDVLLEIKAVGICGSDLHVYRKGQYNAQPGRIMGHEFSGEVVAIGDEVEGVSLGERYTGFTIKQCGVCWGCTHGQPRLCAELFKNYSGYGKPGAMAQFMRIENAVVGENLLPIPGSLSDEVAAMAEPLGTAVYTFFRTKPQAGDQVIVIGAGLIGNLVVQAFKAMGDVKVIVTEVSPERSELARRTGADVVIDARRADLLDAVREETGEGAYAFGPSGMADVVIDAAAAPPTFNQALEFVRSKGTVGLIGSAEEPAPANTGLIINKDIRIIGIFGSTIPHGLALLDEGKIDTDALISHRFGLEDAAEAFATAADPSSTKVMFRP
jgi:threonine dehydrogenase-like Zn-dependent dehydrogenase